MSSFRPQLVRLYETLEPCPAEKVLVQISKQWGEFKFVILKFKLS